jgi:hypothetical protein
MGEGSVREETVQFLLGGAGGVVGGLKNQKLDHWGWGVARVM